MDGFAVLCALLIAYMLPTAVAFARGKSNAKALGLLNLLIGWTVLGWIVALAMACATETHPAAAIYGPAFPAGAAPSGWYAAPDGRGERFWNGATWTDWAR